MSRPSVHKSVALLTLLLALLLPALSPAQSGAGQNQNPEETGVRGFFNSAARSIYAAAWPTATYREWELDDISAVPGGLNVTLTIAGQSAFDQSNLWVRLLVPIRNGSIGMPRVLAHNAILQPPFVTTGILTQLALQLAQQYDTQQGRSSPAPPAGGYTGPALHSTTADNKAAVLDILAHWRAAILANDAASEAALYAPVVQSYYGRFQVNQAQVLDDKAAFINRGYHITALVLDDVTFDELDANSARIQLVKNVTWLAPSGTATHKLIVSHVDLQRYSTGWMITGERDGR